MPHTRQRQRILPLAIALALFAGACSSDDNNGATVSASTTTPAASQPRGPAGWPNPGQNYDNARAAIGSTITSANVTKLKKAFDVSPEGLGSLSTAPLVVGNTLYFEGSSGVVVAADKTTGKTQWTSEPTGTNIGPFGVAVAGERVFAVAGANGVLALNRVTGKQVWRTRLTATATLGIDIQPTVFDGIVFASTVPVSISGIYAPGDRGTIYALNAATGKVKWSFDTVKGPDLWGHPEINSGGGAWYPPAIDTKRRVAYFGVANPAPFPGTPEFPNGTSRPGDNLYTDSLVALNVDTGKLLWFHQVTSHDIFDRDQVHAMVAHTADGKDVVISAGKSGVLVGLDPTNGHQLWRREVGRHEHDDQLTLTGPTEIFPGTYGGVITPPATANGIVYAATLNAPTKLEPDKPAYFGSDLGTGDGEVVAINAATGAVVWDTKVPGDPLGGATVVNDLVLTALLDGNVIALNRDTGAIVWKFDAGGGINGWLSAVDDTLYVPVGQKNPAGVVAIRLP